MKSKLLSLISTLAFCFGNIDIDVDITPQLLSSYEPFELFKRHFQKDYQTGTEEVKRKAIFLDNLEYIRAHGKKKGLTYTLGVNHISDLSFEEFKHKYTSPIPQKSTDEDYFDYDAEIQKNGEEDLFRSSSIDYRKQGCVSPVIDQGSCSSCWAFSTVGSLEGVWCRAKKQLITLSAQFLVDCSRNGNLGCNGGRMDNAFAFIRNNGGVCAQSDYPYRGVQGSCRSCKPVANITKYGRITSRNENTISRALQQYGPIAVAIRSASRDLQLYKGGVFNGGCGAVLDHAVVIVGADVDQNTGQNYWIVKNTWGRNWGEQGFIKFLQNRGTCGINEDAAFPVVGNALEHEVNVSEVYGLRQTFEDDLEKHDKMSFYYDVTGTYPLFSNNQNEEVNYE